MEFVFPGDKLGFTNGKFGPGIKLDTSSCVIVSIAGKLQKESNSVFFVDSCQKKYIPGLNDSVIGTITAKLSESYKVDIGASQEAVLGNLSFEGATKRNRPNLQVGDLVFAKVITADKNLECEITCLGDNLKSDGFGELKEGMVFDCPSQLCRRLAKQDSALIEAVGRSFKFDIAIGFNSKIWINSSCAKNTVLIANALLSSERASKKQANSILKSLLTASASKEQ